MSYILLGIFAIFLRIDNAIGDKNQPYICLDARSDLPKCNFTSMNNDNVKTNHERMRAEKYLLKNPVESFGSETIIYRLEGCRPSRLPFKHPSCTKKDLTNPAVEVHIIFPFIIENNKSDDTQEAPLIFPKIIESFGKFQTANPTNIILSYDNEKNEKTKNKLFVRSILLDDKLINNNYKSKHRHNHKHNQLEKELIKESEINSSLLQRYINNMKNNIHKNDKLSSSHYKKSIKDNIDNIVPIIFPYNKAISIDKSKYKKLQSYNKNEYNLKNNINNKNNILQMDFLSERLLNNLKLQKEIKI